MTSPLAFGIDLDTIVARIVQLGHFLSVEDVLSAADALNEETPARAPAAYVAIASEKPLPNRFITGSSSEFDQRVPTTVGVLFVEQAARYDAKAGMQMDQTRKAVIRQLIAWTPGGALEPLQYASYRIVQIGAGLVWGEASFTTSYRLTLT